MKTLFRISTIIILGSLISLQPIMAQKKNKVKKTKVMFNKIKSLKDQLKVQPGSQTSEPTTSTKDEPYEDNAEPRNRKLKPPDVRMQIYNANQAFSNDSYTEARFYIQQAIMGIELEMGYQILASMPETVLQIQADQSQDEVYSTGAGFVGMTISREYPGDEGLIKASIGNNSALYSYVGMQASYNTQMMAGGDEDTKVIRYKGSKAYLKVDDYNGFEMMIPFGQSSVFVLMCSLCESEEQLMQAADLFDIAEFKSLLGEQ